MANRTIRVSVTELFYGTLKHQANRTIHVSVTELFYGIPDTETQKY